MGDTEQFSVEESDFDASSHSATTTTESSTSTDLSKLLKQSQVKSLFNFRPFWLQLVLSLIDAGLFCNFDGKLNCLACSYSYDAHDGNPKVAHERARPQCPFVRNQYRGLACHLVEKLEQRWNLNDSEIADAFSKLIETSDDRRFPNGDVRSFYLWALDENPSENDEIQSVFQRLNAESNRSHSLWCDDCLQRLISARFDLEVSQLMLSIGYDAATIQSCWDHQLRWNKNDFDNGLDLLVACELRQKLTR